MEGDYTKGRGAQFNARNKFLIHEYVHEHPEGIDEIIIRAHDSLDGYGGRSLRVKLP